MQKDIIDLSVKDINATKSVSEDNEMSFEPPAKEVSRQQSNQLAHLSS